MASRNEKFARKPSATQPEPSKIPSPEPVIKFSPEEEATLLTESNEKKASANELFGKSEYQDALDTYDAAVAACPNYLEYEVAVLKSNIAACYLKMEDWKEAVKAAGAALEGLDRLQGKNEVVPKEVEGVKESGEDEEVEEIVSEGAAKAADTNEKGKRGADIERIRAKALMRRARARSEIGGWAVLQGAEDDYKTLSKMPNLSAGDRKIVQQQLVKLPPRKKAAQDEEMGEMMGKLKGLGNSILKPFGLSTNNFNMVKDEKSGGYSMNFNQGAPSEDK